MVTEAACGVALRMGEMRAGAGLQSGEERLDIAMDIYTISPAFETVLPLLGTDGRTSKG